MRVVYTDAKSYLSMTPDKCLHEASTANKSMYLEACLQRRRHFSLFLASFLVWEILITPVVGWDIMGYESELLPSYNNLRNCSYYFTLDYNRFSIYSSASWNTSWSQYLPICPSLQNIIWQWNSRFFPHKSGSITKWEILPSVYHT